MVWRRWFYRLFFIFAGLIALHVLITTGLLSMRGEGGSGNSTSVWQIWLLGGASIAAGGVVMWFVLRRMMQPLVELSRHVRSLSGAEPLAATGMIDRDDLGALAGVFDRMQRDLADRRE